MTKAKKNPKLRNASPEDNGYPALAKILSDKIRRGFYSPGQKLEGVRKIAEEYGVGRRVADSALDLLVLQGLLRVEPRKGFFVDEKIRPKCNYRLGIYVFGMSPCVNGCMLQTLCHEASLHKYDLIYGSDYNGGDDLRKWLKKTPELDGLLLAGYISENNLKCLAKYKKPYLLIGKHDVNEKHPSEDNNCEETITKSLIKAFAPFSDKKIGAIVGDSDSASDKAVMRCIRKAIEETGGTIYEKCLVHADGYGLARTRELIEKQSPEVIFAIGVFQLAVLRELKENPKPAKPYLIGYSKIDLPDTLEDIFDQYLEIDDIEHGITISSIKRLINQIEKQV